LAHENHVFSSFGPYSALISTSSDHSGAESLTFDQTSKLRLKRSLISSNYT